MSKFSAKNIEAMEFDFTDFGGRAAAIPEPSTETVREFMNEMRAIAKDAAEMQGSLKETMDKVQKGEEIEAADLAVALSQMNDETIQEFDDRLAKAVAVLCSDTPSAEEFSALPYRAKGAFVSWLTEEIRPEAHRPAAGRR